MIVSGNDSCTAGTGGAAVVTFVTGVWPFIINGFKDIVLSIKCFITDQLYPDRSICKLFNGEDCNILEFTLT